jgi:hypothetical protein
MTDYYVTVCASCLTASCWHGEHGCQSSKTANICDIKASQLDKEKREHPGNYSREKLLAVCGTIREVRS